MESGNFQHRPWTVDGIISANAVKLSWSEASSAMASFCRCAVKFSARSRRQALNFPWSGFNGNPTNCHSICRIGRSRGQRPGQGFILPHAISSNSRICPTPGHSHSSPHIKEKLSHSTCWKALHNRKKKRNVSEISFAQHPTNFPSSFYERHTKPKFSFAFSVRRSNSSPLVAPPLALNEYLLLFYCICWILTTVQSDVDDVKRLIKLLLALIKGELFTTNFKSSISWECEALLLWN